ncbi:lytic transglycosylase domain-containing protein [Nocardioides caldifontis]|uniref:lytic transglycosylase domain-containing protein n=1 Tax=Nocardioides caldifontis TaxID=2588938 RepID=UPI0011E0060D|nr:lytic transglycosylase domain-containing protein [Nocardioides caldifontis]
MTTTRLTTWQKATALVPLAVLSGAWTASLAVTSATADDSRGGGQLPDGTTVPSEAIEDPASVAAPGEIAPGIPNGQADKVVKNASTNGIPSAALAAYQRAAQVIDSADPSCNIEWPLIAAIGRVESDHGRYGGNTLTAEGVTEPGIYGIALDGTNGTAKITDTDAGRYDNDQSYDRAVGPMQFIPSTWAVVGVDGDGDGQRNPQDIDDAALATAVYLCSGDEDLATRPGQEAAVYRYNHSDDYVRLVLSIMAAYADGDYNAVPNSTSGSTTFTPSYGDSVVGGGTSGYEPPRSGKDRGGKGLGGGGGLGGDLGGSTGGSGGSTGGSGGDTGGSTGGDTGGLPGGGSGGSGGDGGTGGGTDAGKQLGETVKKVTKPVEDTVKDVGETVEQTLVTLAQAEAMCRSALQNQYGAAPGAAVSQCANALVGKTVEAAEGAVGGVVAGLSGLVKGLLGGLLGGGKG